MTTLQLPPASTIATLDPIAQVTFAYLARCKAESTRRAYEEDLRNFFAWLDLQHLRLFDVKRMHLDLYILWMQQQNRWSESTISRRIGTACGLLKYAAAEDYIPKDVTLLLERPSVDKEKQHRTWLNPIDWALLLRTATEGSPVEHGLIVLLGLMALRIGEACSLDIESVGEQNGYLVLRYIGKGGKAAESVVPVPATRAIRQLIGDRETGPLLLNEWGQRMNRRNAGDIIKRLCKRADLPTNITPHSLRRTFATTAELNGVSISDIQLILRHASPTTTLIYTRSRGNIDRSPIHSIAGRMTALAS